MVDNISKYNLNISILRISFKKLLLCLMWINITMWCPQGTAHSAHTINKNNKEKPAVALKNIAESSSSNRSLLTNNKHHKNLILILDAHKETQGFEYQFVESFLNKILNDYDWQFIASISGSQYYDEPQMYETEDINYIKRNIVFRAACSTFNDIFKQSPLGKKIIKIEQKISRNLTIEYSKGVSTDKASFYLPGQLSSKTIRKEKSYKVSLSPIFNMDTNSLSVHSAIKFGSVFNDTLTEAVYDFRDQELDCSIGSRELNDYIGAKLSLGFIYEKYNATSSMIMKLSKDF